MAAALILGEHRVAARHHILAERHAEGACALARRGAAHMRVCNVWFLVGCDPLARPAGPSSPGQASMGIGR